MTSVRTETNGLGEVRVSADKLWVVQTQRSLEHFSIGRDLAPCAMITVYATAEKAAASANHASSRFDAGIHCLIDQLCDEILAGQHHDMFPLHVWKTGGRLGDMNTAELATLLRSGKNASTASFGFLNDVVVHSLQYLTDSDLNSLATYLKSLPPRNISAGPYRYDNAVRKQLLHGNVAATGTGAQLYLDRCAGCHRSDGAGNGKVFPALAGNPTLQTSDPTSAIHIVLSGSAMPATHTAPSVITMGPYADILTDEQIAEVATFVQTGWSSKGAAATAFQVAKIRKSAEAGADRELDKRGPKRSYRSVKRESGAMRRFPLCLYCQPLHLRPRCGENRA